jgi:hypothetical protein
MKLALACSLALGMPFLVGAHIRTPVPSAFRFAAEAQPELHRLWEASSLAKAERVGSPRGDSGRLAGHLSHCVTGKLRPARMARYRAHACRAP